MLLKEHVKFNKISQTKQIEILSANIIDLMNEVCKLSLEDKLNDETLNFIFEVITSEDYLKQEFIQFLKEIYMSLIDVNQYNQLREEHLYLFVNAFACYLISLQTKQDDLNEKKLIIQQILNYSNKEIVEKFYVKHENDEKYIQYINEKRQSIYS